MTSLKLAADAPLQQLTLTLKPNFFYTNDALFATGNKRTANDVSCLRMPAISCLNADSGR